jgi:membrane protein
LTRTTRRDRRGLARLVVRAFAEHSVLTYASAIAFRAIVALVPVTLLGLALLGALGVPEVWSDTIAPALEPHVTTSVYRAIDDSVRRILSSGTAGLIAFAAALVVWDMTWALDTVRKALNEIHDVQETRTWLRRTLTVAVLAIATSACLIGAVFLLTLPSLVSDGGARLFLQIVRWIAAPVLLGLAVGLVVRYASAERPHARWASTGSLLVIASWILTSLAFRWWVSSVADFKTAAGSLLVLLFLSAYVFLSAAIFLAGVQLDELLRKESGGELTGVGRIVRDAVRR